LDEANITTNKNTVPNDPQSPFVTSGIRLGTPALTTRGFKEEEIKKVAEAIHLVLDTKGEKSKEARAIVKELCCRFPLSQWENL
jgi:glycine hydroxymethyltransferase